MNSNFFLSKTFVEIGAARGDNVDFFLRLGMKGVAVEGHPDLADGLRRRFEKEIEAGNLSVVSAAAVRDAGPGLVDFACHAEPGRSYVLRPDAEVDSDVKIVKVRTIDYSGVTELLDAPDYFQIRINGLEDEFLRSMIGKKLPRHICVNFSSVKPIAALYDVGYRKFKFVNSLLNKAHRPEAMRDKHILPGTGGWDGYFGELLPGKKWLSIEEMAVVVKGLSNLRTSDTAILGHFDVHAAL